MPRREQSSGTGVDILGEYSKSATGEECPCATGSALLPPMKRREKRGWGKKIKQAGELGVLEVETGSLSLQRDVMAAIFVPGFHKACWEESPDAAVSCVCGLS